MRRPLLFAALLAASLLVAAPAYAACGSNDYSYAGLETHGATRGVAASITALSVPDVKQGHVVGWVGVNGASTWIQIGMSAYPQDRTNHVYVEITRPGRDPVLKVVRATMPSGQSHRFAVLELARHPNWWRAWLDGKPASRAVFLPGSHGRWKAQVTAESWNEGSGACNLYAYSFRKISLASKPGGAWRTLTQASIFEDPGYRLAGHSRSAFLASSTVKPSPNRLIASAAKNG
jgi:hypothetical protein